MFQLTTHHPFPSTAMKFGCFENQPNDDESIMTSKKEVKNSPLPPKKTNIHIPLKIDLRNYPPQKN